MTDKTIKVHQAQFEPIESLEKLSELLSSLGNLPPDLKHGMLTDDGGRNQIILLFAPDFFISLRLNLTNKELQAALKQLNVTKSIEVRHMQGRSVTRANLESVESLTAAWDEHKAQSMEMPLSKLTDFFKALWSERPSQNGRGKKFTKSTLDKLARDCHGYCMFEGCGEHLTIDSLSGYIGNYGYNAHNVASSESGPRGVPFLSQYLSDDPQNVLVLCDKHHRLIDKVAAADFDASRLSAMRKDFTYNVHRLLEGLSFKPIPAFSILWPVGGQVVSEPDEQDIASCLARIKSRVSGRLNRLSHNEKIYRRKKEIFERDMASIVEQEATEIIQQTHSESHKAALFAFGPMPALVGLGACLGNKCEVTPMLRYRDGGCWMWPQESIVEKPYEFKWNEKEIITGSEVTLCIGMTGYPKSMKKATKDIGNPVVEVLAKQMGNAAIPHPENGKELRAELHNFLMCLFSVYEVRRVHLLICASNAVSVFVGQAFDLYQPSLLVYDFNDKSMEPRLLIEHVNGNPKLSVP